MKNNDTALSPIARLLELAGLILQIGSSVLVISQSEWQWTAMASAFGYAAFIFSFLGGVWCGLAPTKRDVPNWIYAAAVIPSLI